MTDENKRANILQEIMLASGALEDARLLHTNGRYNAAVSRAYYHALWMARALLLTLGLEASTHSGVAHLVSFHFVQTKKLASATHRTLGNLFQARQEADYDSAAVFDEQLSEEAIMQAESYGRVVRKIIQDAGFPTE